MRKRNYLIGMAGALVLSLGVAGTANAAGTLTGQTVKVTASSKPQDKKAVGPISSLKVEVDTTYDGNQLPPFTGKAINTKVDFPKDFVFTPPKAQCDPNTGGFNTSTTEVAKSLCGPAQVGTGSARILAPAIVGGQLTANVTAFNGTTPEGLPTILLHSRTSAGTTTVLVGTLRRSDQGGKFGTVLDVIVPPLPLGAVIVHFETTIPQLLTVKANKKKNKPAKYYVGAKCSTKTWNFQARSTYDNGATTIGTSSAPCKQKKSKKKKKKKK